jgi:8-oxo-dGTP pyrophosphatase MutT (NUDIX family)
MTADREPAQQPERRLEVQVLFFDADARVLLVESPRREWLIPGGIVEPEESPWAACSREVQEQLGLTHAPQRLLAVDWVSPESEAPEALVMVFNGGILSASDIAHIWLPIVRLRGYAFCTPEEISGRLSYASAARLTACLEARASGTTVVMQDGVRVL